MHETESILFPSPPNSPDQGAHDISIIGAASTDGANIGPEGNFCILESEVIEVYLQSMIPKEMCEPSAVAAVAPAPAKEAAADKGVQMGD